jgi:hypothetical protein
MRTEGHCQSAALRAAATSLHIIHRRTDRSQNVATWARTTNTQVDRHLATPIHRLINAVAHVSVGKKRAAPGEQSGPSRTMLRR